MRIFHCRFQMNKKLFSLPVCNTEVCYPSQLMAVSMKLSARSSLSLLPLYTPSSKLLDSQKREATKYLLQQQSILLNSIQRSLKCPRLIFYMFKASCRIQTGIWKSCSQLFIKYKMLCTPLDWTGHCSLICIVHYKQHGMCCISTYNKYIHNNIYIFSQPWLTS